MSVSLTKFVDFVNAKGLERRVVVEKTLNPDKYETYKDFYKNLRDAIVAMHKENAPIDSLPGRIRDANDIKKKHFNEIVCGYQKWAKSKRIVFWEDNSCIFDLDGVNLSINPELILLINREPTVVKLYFKQENLEKDAANMIATLLLMAFQDYDKKYQDYRFGILDIRRGRLYRITSSTPINEIMETLRIEAASWLKYTESLYSMKTVETAPLNHSIQ